MEFLRLRSPGQETLTTSIMFKLSFLFSTYLRLSCLLPISEPILAPFHEISRGSGGLTTRAGCHQHPWAPCATEIFSNQL